jgi:hypothetical protein
MIQPWSTVGGQPSLTVAQYNALARVGRTLSHEQFCHAVREIAVSRLTEDSPKAKLLAAKLVYGIGGGSYRGICYYGAWHNGQTTDFIEIAATGEESALQLAGTTIHETGHVLAGPGAGHGKEWKDACFALGLRNVMAAGQQYDGSAFAPETLSAILALGEPSDGNPNFRQIGAGNFVGLPPAVVKPCPMGRGRRGGRMTQSTRLRLYECECSPSIDSCPKGKPHKVRVAEDYFSAVCGHCAKVFKLIGEDNA